METHQSIMRCNNDLKYFSEANGTVEKESEKIATKQSTMINGQDTSLHTLEDTIKFIIRRDSNRSLQNMVFQKNLNQDPWKMESLPMTSSPRIMTMPDLDARRQEQLRKHNSEKALRKKRQKQNERNMKEKMRQKQQQQFQNRGELKEQYSQHEDQPQYTVTFPTDMDLEYQNQITEQQIANEDEQWERKRREKLQKVVEKSNSSNSLANMTKSSSTCSLNSNFSYFSPSIDIIRELEEEFSKRPTNSIYMSITYGLINAVIVLPVIMSFGSIIYHDEFFRPYLPVLVKLTVFSGIVHQLCFSTISSLPFAVGQVQDAGLIFLSTMATSMVKYCQDKGYGNDDETILATVLVGLSISTALLGVGLFIIGRFKLATFVQYLPTPVVGGYLAFIGFFCGQSGISLMGRVGQVSDALKWYNFFQGETLWFILPGLLGGFTIYLFVRTFRHMAVLPACILSMLVCFYLVLGITGTTVDVAREKGWMNEASPPPVWYKTWEYFKFDKVVWSALPGQTLTLISMIFVVALSSSLDVAAIDLEVPKPLEYNYELRMIGISNIVSGLAGGYTGSYIFSQSIFSLRAGITSRKTGYIVALTELISVVIPISILDYVPNFFFGSLLIMICVDLMVEWLWDVRHKFTNAEYSVTLSTFVLIQMLGVEYGIIAGVIYHFILLKVGFSVGGGNESTNGKGQRDCERNKKEEESMGSMIPNESNDSFAMYAGYGATDENSSSLLYEGKSGALQEEGKEVLDDGYLPVMV